MADTEIRVERYENGVLVSTRTVTRPAEDVNRDIVGEDLSAALPVLATLIGSGTDPAGTTTLQAIKNQTNATINATPAPYVKALADALITLARNQRKQIRSELRAFDAAD
jgi:hypothetical protein